MPSPIDTNKFFVVNRSELDGRFDPKFIEPSRLNFYRVLKSHKDIVRLKEIIKDGSYGILPPGDSYDSSLPIKFIRATELKEDLQIDFKNVNYVEEKYYTYRAALKKDDVLLAVKGATIASNKCVAFVNTDIDRSIINGSIFRMQINEKAIPLYIAYILNSELLKKQMKFNLVANNAVDYLDKSLIYNLLIPLPDLIRQQEIIVIYQTAFTLKQQKESEAKFLLNSIGSYLLKELGITLPSKSSIAKNKIFTVNFSDTLGSRLDPVFYNADLGHFSKGLYPMKPLNKIINSLKSGIGAGKQDQALDGNGIIQVRPTNMDENRELDFTKNVHLPFDSKYELLEPDDVLFNNTNSQELVGKTVIYKGGQPLTYSNHITVIKVKKEVLVPEYLWLILNLFQKHKIFYSMCTNWNNQSGVGIEQLNTVAIPLPPLEIQNQIVNYIQIIREQARLLQSEAESLLEDAKKEVEILILG